MEYKEVALENEQLVEKSCITIDQSKLTSDCWLIQFKGLIACKTCELKGTDECGGRDTLKKLQKEGTGRFQIREIVNAAGDWLNENVLTEVTKRLLPYTISDFYLVDNEKQWVYCSTEPIMVSTWYLGTRVNHDLEFTEEENEEIFEIEMLYDESEKDLCLFEGKFIEEVKIDPDDLDLTIEEDYKEYTEKVTEYYRGNPVW